MSFKQYIPRPVKSGIRQIQYHLANAIAPDPFVPPPDLQMVVGGHFRTSGKEFLRHFIELGEMKPTDRILDIGSGTGRMTIQIKDFLSTGTYSGTEIVKRSVDWCQQAYVDYPRISFYHSDVYNEFYNPDAEVKASEYRFPFSEASFDFIFLTSVFTHMFTKDVENYLDEIARILVSDGRVLITAFLLNEQTRHLMQRGKAELRFVHRLSEGCWTAFDDRPAESAIAFEEEHMRAMIEASGLTISGHHPGRWRGSPGRSVQDILVLRRID